MRASRVQIGCKRPGSITIWHSVLYELRIQALCGARLRREIDQERGEVLVPEPQQPVQLLAHPRGQRLGIHAWQLR